MLIVYVVWTPNRITLLEAGLTLTYLPIMVGCAYLIDARPWKKADPDTEDDDTNATGCVPWVQLHRTVVKPAHKPIQYT